MKPDCDTCQGIEPLTPEPVANRPGLPALRYRVGTHGSFLESMLARLSVYGAEHAYAEAATRPARRTGQSALPPSSWLRTREPADPTIAMLDAWSTVGDILTFYQERIANEGYLGTAIERRSIHELAHLVGYKLRPALSSSVFLAFDVQPPPALDRDVPPPPPHEVQIPKGTQARHIPGPGEQPQVFETTEELIARPEWNQLKPRVTKPMRIDATSSRNENEIRVERIDTGVQPGDLLLLVCPPSSTTENGQSRLNQQQTAIRRVKEVILDPSRQQSVIKLVDSPFSVVAYREALARSATAFLSVSRGQGQTPDFPNATSDNSNETPKLSAVNGIWQTAMDGLRAVAAGNVSTLLQTDHEMFEKVKGLYAPATWADYNTAYTTLSKNVSSIAEALRGKLLTLFKDIKGSGTTGWTASFTALKKVHDVIASDNNNGVNSAVEKLESVTKGTTFSEVRGHSKSIGDGASNLLDNVAIEKAAKDALNKIKLAVDTAIMGQQDPDNDIGDGIAGQIKTAVTTNYGSSASVTARLKEWVKWLSLTINSNSIPADVFNGVPWTVDPRGVVVDQSWKEAAGKADVAYNATATPPQGYLFAYAVETAFLDEIKAHANTLFTAMKDAVKALENYANNTIEVADTNELTRRSTDYSSGTNSVTTCVNNTLALLSSLEETANTKLKYQVNRDKVAKHAAAAQTAQELFEKASVPAATAVLAILAEEIAKYPTDQENETTKFLKQVRDKVKQYQYSNTDANKSRLTTLQDELFLRDARTPTPNDPQRVSPDIDYLRTQLKDKVVATDIEAIISRLITIDDALKTKAPQQTATPFSIVSGQTILGATGSLLPQLQPTRRGGQTADQTLFPDNGDIFARLLTALGTRGGEQLVASLKKLETSIPQGQVFCFGSRTGLFGAAAPHSVKVTNANGDVVNRVFDPTVTNADDERSDVFFLDQEVAGAVAGGWCLSGRLAPTKGDGEAAGASAGDLPFGSENLFNVYRVLDATHLKRDAYEISGKTTRLQLDHDWAVKDDIHKRLRSTIVLSASRELKVVDSLDEASYPDKPHLLELQEYHPDLPGHRSIQVTGEVESKSTNNLPIKTGVTISHPCQIVSADGLVDGLGRLKTNLVIDPPLPMNLQFVRSSVRIYANVVEATNGATVEEVIGNGEGQGAFQRFLLAQPRLAHLSAQTPTGMQPELEVRVNDVAWDQADSVADLQPVLTPGRVVGGIPQRMGLPRRYLTTVDDDERTFLTTGDGVTTGERLPTGITNVRAKYRVGGGRGGNVKEGTITQLASPPLNVIKVRNLMSASGGVDRENADQARKNLPVAVMALDRLVSVLDYESFTRKFAGIAKAQATPLNVQGRETVVVTIAALDDQPIDQQSLLYRNLVTALRKYADPEQAVRVETRELLLLMTKARLKVETGYLFEVVQAEVTQRILRRFNFEQARLGQAVLLSDLIETIQNTPGVKYVDVDMFDRMRQFYEMDQMVAHATEIQQGLPAARPAMEAPPAPAAAAAATPAAPATAAPATQESKTPPPPPPQPRAMIDVFSARQTDTEEIPSVSPSQQSIAARDSGFFPAQLAYFTDLAGTILLEEIR